MQFSDSKKTDAHPHLAMAKRVGRRALIGMNLVLISRYLMPYRNWDCSRWRPCCRFSNPCCIDWGSNLWFYTQAISSETS